MARDLDLSDITLEAPSVDLAPSGAHDLVLVLVLPDGTSVESALVADQPVVLGRATDAGICVDDASVSRHHAEVCLGPKGPVVRDLGSRNGTWINEERISSSFVPILSGDAFRFGGVAGAVRRVKRDG